MLALLFLSAFSLTLVLLFLFAFSLAKTFCDGSLLLLMEAQVVFVLALLAHALFIFLSRVAE
ncbi:MAG: hypothetical protein J3R72DRAFT_458576 [Linnemannia gamsii]|nr:MAG: hypothetical protein J3R72DRAFT_458576 [Linnemannia gamsii]